MNKTLYQIFAEEDTRQKVELAVFVDWINDPPLKLERERQLRAEEAPIREWCSSRLSEEVETMFENQLIYGHPLGLEAKL